MITTIVVSAALVFLAVLTFLSLFEMSMSRTSKVWVRSFAEKNKSGRAEQLKELVDNRVESLISVYVGIQVCTVSIAIILTAYLHNRLQSYSRALPAAFGIMFLIVVVFRQLIPRIFTFRAPEKVLLRLIPLHKRLKPVLNVVAYPLSSTLRLVRRLGSQEQEKKSDELIAAEIQAFIDIGKEEGILEKEEEELIQSAVQFGDKVAGDIMTPRTDMVIIDVASSLGQLKALMKETKYSRIPVYRGQPENIEGFVYLKDIIDIWDTPQQLASLETLVRPIHFVPETKKVSELLQELQRQASHMAVVVDEFGGVAGFVTIEDIVEEIAGEIRDEDEAGEMNQILKDERGNYLIPGQTPIEEVESLLNIELKSEEHITIGGFIASQLGRVPRRGEKCDYQGAQFLIKEADRRKILQIQASVSAPAKALTRNPAGHQ
ncbi:MAG: hemolysin family protein [Acidobacteriota bacterium]